MPHRITMSGTRKGVPTLESLAALSVANTSSLVKNSSRASSKAPSALLSTLQSLLPCTAFLSWRPSFLAVCPRPSTGCSSSWAGAQPRIVRSGQTPHRSGSLNYNQPALLVDIYLKRKTSQRMLGIYEPIHRWKNRIRELGNTVIKVFRVFNHSAIKGLFYAWILQFDASYRILRFLCRTLRIIHHVSNSG